MPNVVLTIDCEGAHNDRCYTNEYTDVLESEFVPATWLIHVSMKDPTANTKFYYQEFAHRIPNWHEIGMKVNFQNDRGFIEDPKERGHMIRVAKDSLKSHQFKCTSFRAASFALMATDIKYLEDVGILVDSSPVPDAEYRMFVDWDGAPCEPYHSSPEDLKKVGTNRILHIPIATNAGEIAYLDKGFDQVRQIIDANIEREVLCIAMRDYIDSVADLRAAVRYLREKGSHFTTLTQAASEHYEHHPELAAR
jgi:hypothetical protein